MWRKYKIPTNKTTAYKPQSNGSIERSHHELPEYFEHTLHLSQSGKHDWDKCNICDENVQHQRPRRHEIYTARTSIQKKQPEFRQIVFYQTIRTANRTSNIQPRYLIEFSMHK